MTENGLKVLVTGSSQGIGKAIAKEFTKRGYTVIVHGSKNAQKAEKVKNEIGAASAFVCDFSNFNEVKKLHEKTGDVDILILNASVQVKEAWDKISFATFDLQTNVNVKSSLFLMQDYIPAMIKKGFGRVVTIGSANQYRQHPELPMYSATKCAVMSLVKNIAKDVAPHGVTVNNISPGAIATPRNEAIFNNDELRRAVEATIPVGHFGEACDVVGAVMLLSSKEGAYITGSDIIIDGGLRL